MMGSFLPSVFSMMGGKKNQTASQQPQTGIPVAEEAPTPKVAKKRSTVYS